MKKILVIGDVIADVYYDHVFKKMCPDDPGVQAIVRTHEDVRAGGAANVALNVCSLSPDSRVYLVGEMSAGLARVAKRLSSNRISMEYCEFTDDVMTKERIRLDGKTLLRADNRSCTFEWVTEGIAHQLDSFLKHNEPDLILLSDYGSGLLGTRVLDLLLPHREKLLVDTKMTDLSVFGSEGRRTRLVKLNYDEWKSVVATEAAPERFFDAMVITRGASGAYLTLHRPGPNERASVTHTQRVSAHRVGVVDVCGCGDTFLAGLGASLLRNDDYFTAMQFANAAAGTVVSRERTCVASLTETMELLETGRTK